MHQTTMFSRRYSVQQDASNKVTARPRLVLEVKLTRLNVSPNGFVSSYVVRTRWFGRAGSPGSGQAGCRWYYCCRAEIVHLPVEFIKVNLPLTIVISNDGFKFVLLLVGGDDQI